MDVRRWLARVVRNLKEKTVVSAQGGKEMSHEISYTDSLVNDPERESKEIIKGCPITCPVRDYNTQSIDYSIRLLLGLEEHRWFGYMLGRIHRKGAWKELW